MKKPFSPAARKRDKRKMKFDPKAHRLHFIASFAVVVVALAVAKCVNPDLGVRYIMPDDWHVAAVEDKPDSVLAQSRLVDSLLLRPHAPLRLTRGDGTPVRNRVTSVVSFSASFPDLNDVQLATASRLGVPGAQSREDAAARRDALVYIGDNPFYTVQRLNHSVPYLVPRAATLLSEIARAFNDSLATKGQPPYKLFVTSVLRTREDVERLRRHNRNASENSCHQYGTTFDISYNRFLSVKPDAPSEIRWVTVNKSILAEVLEDFRQMGACYVKYETHQSCFHITAR